MKKDFFIDGRAKSGIFARRPGNKCFGMEEKMRRERYFIRYLYKWLILVFFLFTIVSISFNMLNYQREREYYSEIIEKEQQDRINYLSKNIEDGFIKLKITASMILKEDVVKELYCKWDFINSYERSKLLDNIRRRCLEIDNLNSFVSSSAFYLPERGLKIDGNGFGIVGRQAYDFANPDWHGDRIIMKDGNAYIVEMSRKNYLKGWEEDNILGIFVIELDEKVIREELAFAKMMEGDILFMTDYQKNTLLFQTAPIDLKEIEVQGVPGEIQMDKESYILMHSKGDGYFFELYYMQDQTFIRLIRERMLISILTFTGAIVLTLLAASAVFYRRIYRPLEILLVDAFARIKESHFSYRIPLPEKESVFTNLYQNFNYMAQRIDTLVSRELQQKILVNQANFKHLQAQINPHFMYNSYFLLYRMIKKGDKEGSLLVCESLGKFFKYITRDSEESKKLGDEIAHARSYGVIQGFRFQNILQMDFAELPEKYGYIEVPRLIIQPLIENVFKYVVNELDEEEKIILRVKYEEEGGHLFVCVENSGNIEDTRLERIREKFGEPKENEDITALANISFRLNVFFDQQDSVTVSRSELGGLKVCLRLKL